MHNDNVINKQGLLIFGGEASDDYGMVVAEAPAFDRPIRKQNVFNVPGRNGAIILPQDAFEDTARSYNVWLTKEAGTDLAAAVDAVSAWLMSKTGYNRLEDSFEPDVFRLAYFSGAPTFTNKLMQYGENFDIQLPPRAILKSWRAVCRRNKPADDLQPDAIQRQAPYTYRGQWHS